MFFVRASGCWRFDISNGLQPAGLAHLIGKEKIVTSNVFDWVARSVGIPIVLFGFCRRRYLFSMEGRRRRREEWKLYDCDTHVISVVLAWMIGVRFRMSQFEYFSLSMGILWCDASAIKPVYMDM